MFYRFIFRNMATGETRDAIAHALNPAAQSAGLPFDVQDNGRRTLRAPWSPWECWTALGECLWHYDGPGDCQAGPRDG